MSFRDRTRHLYSPRNYMNSQNNLTLCIYIWLKWGDKNNLQHRIHLHHSNFMRYALTDHGTNIHQQNNLSLTWKTHLESEAKNKENINPPFLSAHPKMLICLFWSSNTSVLKHKAVPRWGSECLFFAACWCQLQKDGIKLGRKSSSPLFPKGGRGGATSAPRQPQVFLAKVGKVSRWVT